MDDQLDIVASRIKCGGLLFMLSLLLIANGIIIIDRPILGSIGLILFGTVFSVMLKIVLRPTSARLHLTTEGLDAIHILKSMSFKWTDVEPFYVNRPLLDYFGARSIRITYTEKYIRSCGLNPHSSFFISTPFRLTNIYKMPFKQVCATLNAWRERSINQQAESSRSA